MSGAMRRLLPILRYLAIFGVARGTLFIAPLVLASVLPATEYGILEWAYATAAVLVNVVTLGTAGLVPVVMVGTSLPGVSIHGIRIQHLAVVMLCAGTVLAMLGARAEVWQVALLIGVLALQGLRSTQAKSDGRANASLLTDASLFGTMAVAAVLARLLMPQQTGVVVWLAASACALVLGSSMVAGIGRQEISQGVKDWIPTLKAGVPLMLTGLVATLVASAGRLGMGWLSDPVMTASYSVLSRGAALPIIAHQVILVARFRNVFVEETANLENILLAIIGLVTASACAVWILSPWLAWMLGPSFANAVATYRAEFLWVLSQAILWSAIALNDLVNNRFGTVGRVLKWSMPALFAMLAIGVWVIKSLGVSVSAFVKVHGMIMLTFYLVQIITMRSQGIKLKKLWSFTVGAYSFLALYAWLS
ncbi:hypothetical protein CJD38_06865 [Stenotrophobium rhamnosiphilum]|uniref:Polysaccharide biosynthesis protein n=1 Tax=Stenotrophobium rhamnosiphilum TaxID=2029166 RepID=A0A2T5MII7_9GAMM|nr:hypothetical protein CJD38_06865 [Stenotrophobium rhamnosiphilum]